MVGADGQAVIRVAIVDDDVWARDRLSEELQKFQDIIVVGAAQSVDELLDGPGSTADLVLLDAQLRYDPVVVENIARIRRAGPKVLLVSGYFREEELRGALRAGTAGFFPKVKSFDALVQAICDASAGRFVISQQAMMAMLNDRQRNAPEFTRRETDVLALSATGLPAKIVAKRLGITEDTVKEYLKRIREKYRAVERPADSIVDLYKAALADGILTDGKGPRSGG